MGHKNERLREAACHGTEQSRPTISLWRWVGLPHFVMHHLSTLLLLILGTLLQLRLAGLTMPPCALWCRAAAFASAALPTAFQAVSVSARACVLKTDHHLAAACSASDSRACTGGCVWTGLGNHAACLKLQFRFLSACLIQRAWSLVIAATTLST